MSNNSNFKQTFQKGRTTMKQLESTRAEFLKKRIESTWDITQHYWYPLYDCKRSDVLAFDDDYIKEDTEKITDIRSLLVSFDCDSIYEMDEYRTVTLIKTNTLTPYLTDNLERFWFSDDMSWIIYVSHDGSITFGGNKLINQLKLKWKDWEFNIFNTEYNLDEDE